MLLALPASLLHFFSTVAKKDFVAKWSAVSYEQKSFLCWVIYCCRVACPTLTLLRCCLSRLSRLRLLHFSKRCRRIGPFLDQLHRAWSNSDVLQSNVKGLSFLDQLNQSVINYTSIDPKRPYRWRNHRTGKDATHGDRLPFVYRLGRCSWFCLRRSLRDGKPMPLSRVYFSHILYDGIMCIFERFDLGDDR